MLQTQRLILRKWTETDADRSLDVIRNVLNGAECYAICEKGSDKSIGAVELMLHGRSSHTERDDECELDYWLGKPFWGRGLMPEAARKLLRHWFEDLEMRKVWCGYFDGNQKSKRVQEKLGFRYHHTCENVPEIKRLFGFVPAKSIVRVFEKHGFSAKAYHGDVDTLKQRLLDGVPIILFVSIPGDTHYAVVVGYDAQYFYLVDSLPENKNADGNRYNRKLTTEEFEKIWRTDTVLPDNVYIVADILGGKTASGNRKIAEEDTYEIQRNADCCERLRPCAEVLSGYVWASTSAGHKNGKIEEIKMPDA